MITPYTDLTMDLTYLKDPYDVSDVGSTIKKYYETYFLHEKGPVNIQSQMCMSYLINASKMKDITLFDQISLADTDGALLIGESVYYLLLDLGTNHMLGNVITAFLRKDTGTFTRVSAGRFINNFSNTFLSIEEDEFNHYYLLLSNRKSLLDFDELFHFTKEILN